MKQLFFRFETVLDFEAPVTSHSFVLRCVPYASDSQRVLAADVRLKPYAPYTLTSDRFGNTLICGSIPNEHSVFHYATYGQVITMSEVFDTAPAPAIYLKPSALTKPTPSLIDVFHSLSLVGDPQSDALRIAEEVTRRFSYRVGYTDTKTTAGEAVEKGVGVCQDFAHVFICLARLAGIPARYVNGLLAGEDSTHAWAQVHVDGAWRGIDPTRHGFTGDDYIAFCIGRDFADCPIERGVFYGSGLSSSSVSVSVDLVASPGTAEAADVI